MQKDLEVPSIVIENIYYMLSYSWDTLADTENLQVSYEDITSMLELLCKVFITACTWILKRGLDRGYIEKVTDDRTIRGKVLLTSSMSRLLFQNGQAACLTDEFSYDVIHNQIIKSTINRLLKIPKLNSKIHKELHEIYLRLNEVSLVNIEPTIFSNIKLNKNNYHYKFPLSIAEMLIKNIKINESEGVWEFKDFLRDIKQMRVLFESFVRNFYSKELNGDFNVVGKETLYWELRGDKEGLNLLPQMQTDISIKSRNHKIIIDTKYTPKLLSLNRFGKNKLRSSHLYQLSAYLEHDNDNLSKIGILLYPSVENRKDENHLYFKDSNQIQVRTINLNQKWTGIHQDLISLVAGF